MKPSKDFDTRLKSARQFRTSVEPWIEEILSFCRPGSDNVFNRRAGDTAVYDTERYISIGEELSTDLAGDLVTYFTPAEVKWFEYEVTAPIDRDMVKKVQEEVQNREDALFSQIQSSNYNDIAPMWGFEAASHGTPALWVDTAHIMQPVNIEVVPPQELLITPGHMGILDRFREKQVLAQMLPAIFAGWPEVSLDDPSLRQLIAKPGQYVTVVWGFWLDWSNPAVPVWRCEITVQGKRVTPDTPLTLGPLAGSCPLLVGRFNPQVGMPWGRGAGWKALPDMRVLDKVDETVLTGLDQSLLNTILYAHDGAIDLSEGIEWGRAYPMGRGFDRNSIFELNRQVNVDQGWFTEERIEDRIRTSFYQDGPRQRGDTPPTAAQWLDERRRVQQRLGKPSAPLWSEMIYPLVQRFEALAVQQGKLDEAITLDGQTINVAPISPLQKAQNQDKVMVARSNLDLGFAVFQDALGQIVDPTATFQNIVRASGDELTVVRSEPLAPPDQAQ